MKKIKHSELWDLDITLAEFILPRLIAFRKMKRSGIPPPFKTMKEWNKEIDRVIYAFNRIVNWRGVKDYYFRYGDLRVKNGLKLFAKHLGYLWD